MTVSKQASYVWKGCPMVKAPSSDIHIYCRHEKFLLLNPTYCKGIKYTNLKGRS